MSLKQLVLGMTSEARKELVELIEWMEAKEAELASEIAIEVSEQTAAATDIEVSKSKESAPEVEAPVAEAPVAEAPVAEAAPGDTEASVA